MNKITIVILGIIIVFCSAGCTNEQEFLSESSADTLTSITTVSSLTETSVDNVTSITTTSSSSHIAIEDEPDQYKIESLPPELQPFFNFNWANPDVLMYHQLEPIGSGGGWNFNLSDIDFDGKMEMLVSFSSQRGDNCLYIYKVVDGEVKFYGEIYAAPEFGFYNADEPGVTKYTNRKLIDVYKNKNGEYRYLTTDDGAVSGQSTVKIYEFMLKENSIEFKEIARNEWPYDIPDPIYNIPCEEYSFKAFFMGIKLENPETLDDKMKEYMSGYSPIELPIITSDITFPRDIVSYSESENQVYLKKLLEDFYKKLG